MIYFPQPLEANVDKVKSDISLATSGPRRKFFNVSLGVADLPNQVYRRILKVKLHIEVDKKLFRTVSSSILWFAGPVALENRR